MDEWVDKFYNLGGVTIFENHKIFFDYIKQLREAHTDIDLLVKTIKPRNIKEQLYIIQILKAFNKEQLLLETILKGDAFLARFILKKTNINLLGITAHEFVNNICPQLSASTKRTWIQKLSTLPIKPEDAESYFNTILETYGLPLATPLLGKCSINYIKSILNNNKPKIPERHLINLHQQSSDFLLHYFQCQPVDYFTKCPMLANHLIKNDPQTYHILLQFGKPKVRGKAYIKYLQHHKSTWLNNQNHTNLTIPELKKLRLTQLEFQQYFTNILPKKATEFNMYELTSYLLLRPKSERGSILFNSYQTKYKQDFSLTPPYYYIYDLLSLLTLEDRLKLNLDTIAPEGYTVDKSIPLLKERINFTADIGERADLAAKLVDTCKLNNDFGALMEVCRYFWERHQNDHKSVRDRFLGCISYRFKLETIGEDNVEFWDMARTQIKRFDLDNDYFDYKDNYLERMIYFKMSNGEDSVDILKDYVKHVGLYMQWVISGLLLIKHQKFAKECIMKISELLDVFQHDDREYAGVNYLFTLNDWNKKFRKDKISPLQYPKEINNVFEYYKRYSSMYTVIPEGAIRFQPQNAQQAHVQDDLLKIYLETWSNNISDEMRVWILKYKPAFVVAHPDRFLIDSNKLDFYYILSNMLHTTTQSCLVKKSYDIITQPIADQLTDNICAAIKLLSFNSDFDNLLKKIDTINKWEIQKAILKCCRQIKNASIALNYCQPNFSPICLNNIHWIIMRTSKINYFDVLLERAPEIRKFAIKASIDFLQPSDYCNMLKRLWTVETDPDVRKLIIKRTWGYSFKHPNSDLDDLMSEQLQQVDKSDVNMLKFFMRFNKIPRARFDEIATLVWNWDCYDDKGYNMKYGIVKHERPNDFTFVDEIVRTVLYSSSNNCVEDTYKFVYRYLRSAGDLLGARVQVFCDRMAVFGENVNEIHALFKVLCKMFVDDPTAPVEMITTLQTVIGVSDDLFIELMLKIVLYCKQYGTGKFNNFLYENLKQTISKLGEEGIEVYVWAVTECLKTIVFVDDDVGFADCIKDLWQLQNDDVKIARLIMSSDLDGFTWCDDTLKQMSMESNGALTAYYAHFLRQHAIK